jgi:hypothetical protein
MPASLNSSPLPLARRGDLVFVSGKGWLPTIIRLASGDPTHVAVVNAVLEDDLEILESTTLNRWSGKRGVQLASLRQKVEASPNDTVWLAFLKPEIHSAMDWPEANRYITSTINRPYDYLQAIGSAIGQYLPWLPSVSLKNALYCSELAAGILRAGKAVPRRWDPTPTPHQLAKWPIYAAVVRIAGPHVPFPVSDPKAPLVSVLP